MQGLGWYLEHIKSTPLLTAEQEKQLSRRVREHSDPIARERMIQANLLLVVKIAKEFANNTGMSLNDLVAEGNLGLMRAVEEFDPDAGVRFSTYAAWWIKQSIKKARINAGQPIRIPAYLAKLISRWRKTSRELEAQLGRAPTLQQIAKQMKISQRKANVIQQGLTAVNAPSQIGSEEAQAASEMLSDTDAVPPDQRLLDDSTGPIVQAVLSRLDERSRQILILRFHMDGYQGPSRTYKDIGKIIGLTRERVRQLEKEALRQLKAVIDEYV
ncbi:MAG: sigma-70 family RNA polymerase sigma factor [Phycisphaerae bacterium]|nr:sigma-70 family RNA polymerase sigma factor [Phycisphaerae bacterium]